jgi:hypothetical protein
MLQTLSIVVALVFFSCCEVNHPDVTKLQTLSIDVALVFFSCCEVNHTNVANISSEFLQNYSNVTNVAVGYNALSCKVSLNGSFMEYFMALIINATSPILLMW